MKQHFLILLLTLMSVIAAGQTETFHHITFTVPANWESDRPENVRAYGIDDQTTGNYCYVIVYPSMPGKGSAQADFEFAWENLLRKPFNVRGKLLQLPSGSRQGWVQKEGETKFTEDEVTTSTRLLTFSNGKEMQAVCILSNTTFYQSSLIKLIQSLQLSPVNYDGQEDLVKKGGQAGPEKLLSID